MKSDVDAGRKASAGFTNGFGKGFTNGAGKGSAVHVGFTNGAGKGMTNGFGKGGFVNGAGRGNANGAGLTNGFGKGMTNGMGLTNGAGRGMTNGLGGMSNGAGFTNGFGGRRFDDQGAVHPKRLSVILVVILVAMLPLSLIFLAQPQGVPGRDIQIDGKFGDWEHVLTYADPAMTPDPALDIAEFAVKADGDHFCAMARAQGDLLARSQVDRYVFFIDSDKSAATGYAVGGIGADYAVEAYGHSGSLQVATTKFSGADQSNWSAFAAYGSGKAAATGQRLEVEANLGFDIEAGGFLARVVAVGEAGRADECAPTVDGVSGALVITQTAMDAAGIVSGNLLGIEMKAIGAPVVVSTVQVIAEGANAVISGFAPGTTIQAGASLMVTATAELSAVQNGTLIKARVGAVTTVGQVAICGKGLAAYAHEAPSTIAIDGAFADWTGIVKSGDPAGDVANPNIDIVEQGAAAQSQSFFAYLRFNGAGIAMAGMSIPSVRTMPAGGGGGGGGGTVLLPRVAGEDVTRIYIDSAPNGSAIGGINADYFMEIRGKGGQILSKNLYTWPARTLVGGVAAEAGSSSIEASVPLSLIGNPAGIIKTFVETTDWQKRVDSASAGMAYPMTSRTKGIEPSCSHNTAVIVVGPGQAFTTIQSAIDSAGTYDGDTIRVWAGTYPENVAVSKQLTIMGNGSANTIIDASGTGNAVTITASGAAIMNFTMTGGDIGIMVQSVPSTTILNNTVSSNNQCGMLIFDSDNNNIANNTASNNNGFGGIYIYSSDSNNLAGNTITTNNADGILAESSLLNTLTNNSITQNTGSGIKLISSGLVAKLNSESSSCTQPAL
jgi:parallel beta-helix repeat protein